MNFINVARSRYRISGQPYPKTSHLKSAHTPPQFKPSRYTTFDDPITKYRVLALSMT